MRGQYFKAESGDGSLAMALVDLAIQFDIPYIMALIPAGLLDTPPEGTPPEIVHTPMPSALGIGANQLWQEFAAELAKITARAVEDSGDRLPKLLKRLNAEAN